jgi:PAS domain S-box-containing protein
MTVSLRIRVILIVLVIMFLFACLEYAVHRAVVLPSFNALEQDQARADMARCVSALERELHHLDILANDWAGWDDTYAYVQTPTTDYETSNLPLSSFLESPLNLIYIVDTEGHVVWGKAYDLDSEEEIVMAEFPPDSLTLSHPLLQFKGINHGISGLLSTSEGPMFTSSRPILTSDMEGPSRGALIMGRLVTDDLVAMVSDQALVDLTIWPLRNGSLPEEARRALSEIEGDSISFAEETKGGNLSIFTTFPDLTDKPALLLRASIPRRITEHGTRAVRFALYFALLGGILIVITLLILLSINVVRPLIRLTQEVRAISQPDGRTALLETGRNDEIGVLSDAFNEMLIQLSLARDQMVETERREGEQARLPLAMAVEQATNIILITDLDGKIQYVNPAFERVTGYDQSEILGKTPRVLRSGEHSPEFYRRLWQTLLEGAVWKGHLRNKKKDGSLYEEDATISPLRNKEERVVGYVGVKRDITHEIELETRLRQAEKLEAVGTLAGGIAHDFNNILVPILGFSELLLLEFPEGSRAHENATKIIGAANRARELVQQILTFSRQTQTHPQHTGFYPLVQETLKLLRATIPTTIEVQQDLGAPSETVFADPSQLHQVIMNLCTNGYQAMAEKGGTLTIALDRAPHDDAFAKQHPALQSDMPHLRFVVRDTGPGMTPEIIARIFDPFFTTKGENKGTGLGLATTHTIVSDLNGEICVQSELTKGTTFEVYLPCSMQSVQSENQTTPALPSGQGERILLVDDEEVVLDYSKQLLLRLGYQVLVAHDAQEALDYIDAENGAIDLVITDQTMPKVTGLELAQKISQHHPKLPVLLSSGFSEAITQESLRISGIQHVIQKPFSRKTLVQAIHEALA